MMKLIAAVLTAVVISTAAEAEVIDQSTDGAGNQWTLVASVPMAFHSNRLSNRDVNVYGRDQDCAFMFSHILAEPLGASTLQAELSYFGHHAWDSTPLALVSETNPSYSTDIRGTSHVIAQFIYKAPDESKLVYIMSIVGGRGARVRASLVCPLSKNLVNSVPLVLDTLGSVSLTITQSLTYPSFPARQNAPTVQPTTPSSNDRIDQALKSMNHTNAIGSTLGTRMWAPSR